MKFDDVKKLQQKKYRQQLQHFLLEGEHLVQELALACQHNPALTAAELWVSGDYEHWQPSQQQPWRRQLINERQMKQLSETRSPQGIVAVVPMSALQPQQQAQRAVYLHEIQDPGNLGTILRTLAWFGGYRCLLSPGSVDPFNGKVVRSSMGAIFHTPIEQGVTLAQVAQRFHHLAYLDMQGQPVASDDFQQCDCLIFGNEARGVPKQALSELSAQAYSIAGQGVIESLNLASVVNMCVYEQQR